jgi:hypothetical protein
MSTFPHATAMSASKREPATVSIPAKQLWMGRVLSGLASAFLLFDGVAKLFKPAPVVEAMTRLGYPDSAIVGVGVVLLVSTIVYLIPRTAVIGALLLTGYLGGAVTTNLRVSGPLFTIIFPVFFGALLWTGLSLRDKRVGSLLA